MRLFKSILLKFSRSDLDKNKCAVCKEQYKKRDCNEWLVCPMCKQWCHNEECFFLTLLCFNVFRHIFVTDFFYNLFNSSCRTYLLYLSPPVSPIQATVKTPSNFKSRNRLTQLTPGSKDFFLGTIQGWTLIHLRQIVQGEGLFQGGRLLISISNSRMYAYSNLGASLHKN